MRVFSCVLMLMIIGVLTFSYFETQKALANFDILCLINCYNAKSSCLNDCDTVACTSFCESFFYICQADCGGLGGQ